MHLPAWKPDLIILNSRGSGNYKQTVGGLHGSRVVEAGRGRWVGGEDKGRYGLSHRVDIWCENSICSSPVIVSQFPLFTHTHAGAHT